MRKIITTTFITLDGVMQAPGSPTEDTSNGFVYGGWSANYWDKIMGDIMDGFIKLPFELLLGKNTYDIFSAYWPNADKNQSIAIPFNSSKKYVVSSKEEPLLWNNSLLITGDVVTAIKNLKNESGPDLWVHGSGNLIQTLLKNGLIDRMHIWTFPVTIGEGKRLFSSGAQANEFKLIESKISGTGVIIAAYEPSGPIKLGSMV